MQNLTAHDAFTEEEQFKEYRRIKREEEAKATVARIECDCLSAYIDRNTLRDICKEADGLKMGAVVVLPALVKPCVGFLGNDPKCSLIAAISCPHGGDTTEIKVAAVRRAVRDGVDEVEVCAPVSYIKNGNHAYFKRECKKLKKVAKNRAVRMVFETSEYSLAELLKACQTAADGGVNCIRINGADGETVAKLKTALKGKCLIKASVAETYAAFTGYIVMGADFVSCKYSSAIANQVLSAEE